MLLGPILGGPAGEVSYYFEIFNGNSRANFGLGEQILGFWALGPILLGANFGLWCWEPILGSEANLGLGSNFELSGQILVPISGFGGKFWALEPVLSCGSQFLPPEPALGCESQFWAPEANSILGLVGEKFWVLGANLGFGGKFFVDLGEFVQLFGPFGISWAGGGRTFEVALYGLLS